MGFYRFINSLFLKTWKIQTFVKYHKMPVYMATWPKPQHFRARTWRLGGFYFCSHFLSSGGNILKFERILPQNSCSQKVLEEFQVCVIGRIVGRFENHKNPNINLVQMGSNGTHQNKTHLEKEKKEKVNIRSECEKIDAPP